ncbi:Bystin [Coccomyxa sp. Obi]|nr:Bystin [Coccomyxa sp. Obi]
MVKRKEANVHQQSLADEIENPATYGVRTRPRPGKRRKNEAKDQEAEEPLVEEASEQVLRVAREQQAEIDAEDRPATRYGPAVRSQAARVNLRAQQSHDSDSDESADLEEYSDDEEHWIDNEIGVDDEEALAKFMAPDAASQQQRTLSDIIMERIREKQEAGGMPAISEEDEGPGPVPSGIKPELVELYQGVGTILKRFTTGKIPKAFKIIPKLSNWEEVLFLTDPEGWSPHATYQATRMFVSNLNAKMAQRFMNLVLLPHVRMDIRENRRLHHALFQALKKAAYKPDAFYKGLLLPLCQSGTCTLREAVILSSVLTRVSLPMLHSAAALARLAGMAYSGVNSFFIRVLLDKKYALPYRVIDALVDHFLSFRKEERVLPVVWHQSLLTFVQRYKHEIRAEDKQQLHKLIRRQFHYLVSPEIHRELEASRSRGEKSKTTPMEVQAHVNTKVTENIRELPPVLLMEED